MTADTVGGVWNYSLALCRALDAHGVRVVLATMGAPPSAAQQAQVASLPNVAVRVSTFALEWMDDPWEDVREAGDWLLGLERAFVPDIVHLNGYAHAALPWSTPVLTVAHSCVLSWWEAVHGGDAPPRLERYRQAVMAGLRACQMVAVPTHAMLDALMRHYGPLPHAIVIPNGIDEEVRSTRDEWRNATPGANPRPVQPFVLAAGRVWDEAKNMVTLARAAPEIRSPVHIAGSDEHPAKGRQPLPGVHTLGVLPTDVLRHWYRNATVFVHPAVYEPFGLAPLEAALDDCALVLGDIPSLREVWGNAAVYVPPRDPSALAAAVNALMDDPPLCRRAADAARERARALTATRMGDAYHAAYRTLATRAATMKGAASCVS